MKVDVSGLTLGQKGSVTIEIEDPEDFFTLTNILAVGDRISGQVRRSVTQNKTGGDADKKTVLVKATIRVTEIEYQGGVDEMRIRGTLTHDLLDGKEGTFQRMMLAVGRPFVLKKSCWDEWSYSQICEAADPEAGATVAAVLMQSGLANVCVVGRNMTTIKATINRSIPKIRQHSDSGKGAEAKRKFYESTAQALVEKVAVDDMRVIIVASPGFWAKEFLAYMRTNQAQLGLQKAFSADKFVLGQVDTAHIQSLDALLQKDDMAKYVNDLKATVQARAWEEFLREMGTNPNKTSNGEANVFACLAEGAVARLLVTDTYIRMLDLDARRHFFELKNQLESGGGEAVIFSTQHASGEALNDFGGIAAFLKYERADPDGGGFDNGDGFDGDP